MNESINQLTIWFVSLKTAVVENMNVLGLNVSSVKFLMVLYTQDYSVSAHFSFLLFQRQGFGNWISCRLRVKVWGGGASTELDPTERCNILSVVFNVHGSVHLNNILIYIQQDATLHSLFYLETALHVSGCTIAHYQERKQLYLQHLVFVTPLFQSTAIVEEWELV
jgi:hypothetical protein